MIPTLQPSQQLQPKYIFGLNSNLRNNLYFMDDTRIIYPAGFHIVCYSLQDKSQSYFQGFEHYRGFSCMTLSPMKRFLAAGVKGEKPAIQIYDTMSQKKKRTLIYHDAPIKEWVSVAFGPNAEAKTLVGLSGGVSVNGSPVDSYLCYFQTDTMKCLASVKVASGNNECLEVAFQPNDATFITVIGKGIFKSYKMIQNEGETKSYTLKQVAAQLQKAPADLSNNYCCHSWMIQHPDHLIVCTQLGEVFLCDENAEYVRYLKNPYHQNKQPFLIEVIQAMQQGFAIGGDNSTIYIYSKEYENIQMLHVKSISDIKCQIKGISFTPISEDTIIVTLSSNLIYSLKLKTEQFLEEQQQFELVSLPFHSCPPVNAGIPINGMDVCVRKPLIVTCGADKYIRIWNYEEKSMEAYRFFNEEAYCVSIHPSGFHIVVGLTDRLRLMNVCVHNNQIKHYREIGQFKQCKEIKFSNGGQYFAAVNAANTTQHIIHIYRFYVGDNPANLQFKGHSGRIRCITWSRDDTILATCGQDGLISLWKVGADTTGQRMLDIHAKANGKNIPQSSVALTFDTKIVYVVGEDRHLREFVCQEPSENKRNVEATLSQICFSSSNKILFAGVCDENRYSGAVRCYKYPFVGPSAGTNVEYQAHDERGIEKMKITADDQYLITAGRDGAIIVFEIKDKDARGQKNKEGYQQRYADDIIVTKEDKADLKTTRDNLKTQLSDITAPQNAINISSKEDQIKQLTDKESTLKQQYKVAYDTLVEKKRETEKHIQETRKQIMEEFEAEIQELEQNQQSKVNKEAEKYEKTKNEKEIHQTKYEKEIGKLQREHTDELKKLEKDYDARLLEERQQRERMEKEYNKEKEKYRETIEQIRKETIGEIEALEEQNQQQILQKTDQGLKAKSEVSMTKKKIQSLLQEEEKQNENLKDYNEQKKQLDDQNHQLKIAIEEQLKQIQDKDKTIGEKERKIYELKKRSQELEKFKFVLDHKIKELKRDTGPRDEEINRMKEKTNMMDQKLKNFAYLNNNLGNVVDALDQELKIMKTNIKKQRQLISFQNVRIKKFKDSVYQAVQFIQNQEELKNKAQEIFKEFHKDDVKPQQVNADILAEYKSQKQYLEKSVEGLKANLQADEEIHKAENIRIMRGNVKLIIEINNLRKKMKQIKSTHNNQEQKGDKKMSQTANSENQKAKQRAIQEKQLIIEQQQLAKDALLSQIQELEAELSVIGE
ncbi:unnamed protein product [Paramecium primaurelia]|uniref:Uncharacterized protein n=1 Tax=Paramecium primaurelia TaxID=5886 RepID=A0A8S1QAZ4_PARPR|nr:unnamed protein product [Paramecium primaurelia]